MKVLAGISTLLLTAGMGFHADPAWAGPRDTVEVMMSVGKEGAAHASNVAKERSARAASMGKSGSARETDAAAAAREVAAFFNRLSTDKDYAARILQAIQKNDAHAVVALIKATMPMSKIAPGRLNPDFHFEFSVTIGSYKGGACFSNDHSCSGHNVTVG